MNRIRSRIDAGEDVISLGQAVPDFLPPQEILDSVFERHIEPATNMYSADPGIYELRKAVGEKLRVENCLDYSTEQVFITPGANGAYSALIPAIAGEGDEVILPAPVYLNHKMAVEIAGCIPIEVPTIESSNYSLDPNAIENAITEKTVAITVVSPNNPTGAVYQREALERVARIAKEKGLWIISDEVYEYFTFDNCSHCSIGSLEDGRGRTVTIGSFSKSYGLTGWRCGYIAAPDKIIEQFVKIHDTFFICAPVISQIAALKALELGAGFLRSYIRVLAERKEILRGYIEQIGRLHWREPSGALFAFVRYEDSREPEELAFDILDRANVGLVPGSAFGRSGGKHLRISFGGVSSEKINEAGERLKWYFENE